jgi:hypothetical protein
MIVMRPDVAVKMPVMLPAKAGAFAPIAECFWFALPLSTYTYWSLYLRECRQRSAW